MKRKTNISVLDNRGIRVVSNLIVGDKAQGYKSGDILDANAIIELITKLMSEGTIISGVVTSAQIEDGTIEEEDLSEELRNKLDNVYDNEDEALYINGAGKQ